MVFKKALLTVFLIFGVIQELYCAGIGQNCREEKTNRDGICRLTKDCPQIQQYNYLPTLCDINQFVIPVICCPNNVKNSSKRIMEQMCDEYSQFLTHDCAFDHNPLIVGGKEAEIGEYTFMASIGDAVSYFCGGFLISKDFVLTAAHCAKKTRTLTKVKLGHYYFHHPKNDKNTIISSIKKIYVYPNYKVGEKYNDIALLELSKPVVFNSRIKPICLWTNPTIDEEKVVAAGWGNVVFNARPFNVLHKVELDLHDNQVCNEIYTGDDVPRGIINSQMCAGGEKDTCNGDSGGPIFIYNKTNNCIHYAVGITSFGKITCGHQAGVYTRLYSYLDWIEEIVWPNK